MSATTWQERRRRRRPWLLALGLVALLSPACGDGSGGGPGTAALTTGIRGVVMVSPSCAAVAVGENCPETPVREARVVVRAPGTERSREARTSGAVVATVTGGKDGTFSLPLAPGDYVVVAEAQSIPRCEPVTVRVPSSGYAEVRLLCDSGIR